MKAIITIVTLTVVFFGLVFGVKAKDSSPEQKKPFDLETRKIACQYFLFPWRVDSWAKGVQSGNKADRFQEEKLLNRAAESLKLVLIPKPALVKAKSIQEVIGNYLLIADNRSESFKSSLPKTAFVLGMKSDTLQCLLKIGYAKPVQAGTGQNKFELGREFDYVIALSRISGLPEALNIELESIKTGALNASTDNQYLAELKRIRQWRNNVVLAFNKPVTDKGGGK